MSLKGYLLAKIKGFQKKRDRKRILKRVSSPVSFPRECWPESLIDPSAFYLQCFAFFNQRLPEEIRVHRQYFQSNQRGFGEESFHVMWYLIFQEFRPERFLEIGVYRGQTLSLALLLQRHFGYKGTATAISPFEAANDSVTRYLSTVNYLEDTKANLRHFRLPEADLIKAYSTSPLAQQVIASQVWDCIYIDGNHDYEIVSEDWEICSQYVAPGGLIVMDDSGLSTSFNPPSFATKGHPGPSRLVQEIDSSKFKEILQVGHNRVFQKQ